MEEKAFEISLAAVKIAVYEDVISDLRAYAEAKFQNGEIELAHGILKAVCRIRQKADETRLEAGIC